MYTDDLLTICYQCRNYYSENMDLCFSEKRPTGTGSDMACQTALEDKTLCGPTASWFIPRSIEYKKCNDQCYWFNERETNVLCLRCGLNPSLDNNYTPVK